MPHELMRIHFEAIKAFTGDLRFVTLSGAIRHMRANGTLDLTGRRASLIIPGNADYSLRLSSPCAFTGDTTVLAGRPRLRDLHDTPITDETGRVIRPKVSMGAIEIIVEVQAGVELEHPRLEQGALRFDATFRPDQLWGIEVSTDLVSWLLEKHLTDSGGVLNYQEPVDRSLPNKFFRLRSEVRP